MTTGMSTQPKRPGEVPRRASTSSTRCRSGRYEKYEEAQKAVDYLRTTSSRCRTCLIVGTDLKQLERVTGRLTWGRVALRRRCSRAMWLGLFVGLIFSLFDPQSTGSVAASS